LEAYVADEFCGNFFTLHIVTADHEAGALGFPPGLIDPEKPYTRHRVERTNDLRIG
jgi:hypothetical protein